MQTDAFAELTSGGAVRLADWGVIRATGTDARAFLHGQLTQDIAHLEAGRARLAGYCSAKGRLLASFVAWSDGPQDILLACSADLLPALLKRLTMFVLRADCRLSDASNELPLWGLAGAAAVTVLGADAPAAPWDHRRGSNADLVRLADAGVDAAAVPRFLCAGSPPPGMAELAAPDWQWLEVMSGVPRIVAATVDRFVPQMVNLELVGGVDFGKGCYPGQEVVARSQYRGTLKRRAALVQSPVPLLAGQELFSSADPEQPAGLVVLAGTLRGQHHAALVELKIAALISGTLHAGAADGVVLEAVALPYAIPAEAA